MVVTSSTKVLPWFRHHLNGIGLDNSKPTTLLVDSQCALDIANNSKISERSKDIELQHFFIREHIEAGIVKLQHVPSDQQVADTLTKRLSRTAFERCADMLALKSSMEKSKRQKVVIDQQPERRGEVLNRTARELRIKSGEIR